MNEERSNLPSLSIPVHTDTWKLPLLPILCSQMSFDTNEASEIIGSLA